MPAADELYLLYQKCEDLTNKTFIKWEEHFQWLQDVVTTAKQAKSDAFIPKTPHKKKKGRKNDSEENKQPILPPPQPSNLPDAETTLKRSSRAAAKAAQEKNKKALLEISNLGVKLRRPSTPTNKTPSPTCVVVPQEQECMPVCEKENIKEASDTSICSSVIPTSPHSQSEELISLGSTESINKEKNFMDETKNETKTSATEPQIFKEPLPLIVISKPTAKPTTPIKDTFTEPDRPQNEEQTRPVRTTRTKKRIADDLGEQKEEAPVRTTRTKKRKMQEEQEIAASSGKEVVEDSLHLHLTESEGETAGVSDKEVQDSGIEPKAETVVHRESPQRITRSKVRKIVQKDAPQLEANSVINQNKIQDQKKELMQSPKKYIGSPHHVGNQKKKFGNFYANSEVEEISVESINVQSTGKVVKHKRTESAKPANSVFRGSKASFFTPPPSSGPTRQLSSVRGIFNSGNVRSAFSQSRAPLQKASPQITSATKGIMASTPSEGRRLQNIATGPSFVTRVQPSKPTREESEERKKEDLRKRREREEETCRKKEELLRLKTEEKKRKNEERMRRAQELREANAAEQRAKEERKRNKKNEEKKRQAEEEQRQREEQRAREEQKRLVEEEERRIEEQGRQELKRIEEEQKRIAEERRVREELEARKEEEERRIIEEKRQAAKKAREIERINREKEELERCKAKEGERQYSDKKLNETYTAETATVNTTYTKTPMAKESKKVNPNDYGITDLQSDDSTDEDCAPKKEVPLWAKGSQLRKQLFDQEHYPPNIDAIFPHQALLQMPDLCRIFPRRRSRFKKRTSSAVWNTPPHRVLAPNK